MSNKRVPVLLYHSIVNKNSQHELNVDSFEDQISYLKKIGYKSIHFNEIKPEIKNQIILTFDDGYKDNILNALPILIKYGFKATCFIVSNHIGKYNIWDINKKNYERKELMNNYDINEWLSHGMLIGSHTHNHLDLTKYDVKEIKNEINFSKNFLENTFSQQVNDFCYPFGKVNTKVFTEVKRTYKNAVTTKRSRYNLLKHNNFLIPRVDMGKNLNKIKILLKLKTIYEDIKYNEIRLHM